EFGIWGLEFYSGDLAFSLPQSTAKLPHANFIRHPALRRAAPGQLFWDDEARDRAAASGGGVLLHRRLSFDDLVIRPQSAKAEQPRGGAGFSCVRPGPEKSRVFSAIRCARSGRTDLAAGDGHADGAAGTGRFLQR